MGSSIILKVLRDTKTERFYTTKIRSHTLQVDCYQYMPLDILLSGKQVAFNMNYKKTVP